jgi:hypothetical protein
VGKRVVESYFDAGSGRWKNRVVGGPGLPNEYVDQAAAIREGRSFAEFLSCEFRVAGDDAPDAPPDEPGGSPEQRATAAHGHVQALAARLERLESGESADLEDALSAELAARVAAQLAAAAQEYAVAAHELAAHLHRVEADHLDSVGEFERAELQRKAAAIDDDLASGRRRSHPAG